MEEEVGVESEAEGTTEVEIGIEEAVGADLEVKGRPEGGGGGTIGIGAEV